jgi:hypothetical protein
MVHLLLRGALVIPLFLSLSLSQKFIFAMSNIQGLIITPSPLIYTLEIGQYNGRNYSNVATLRSCYGWLIKNSSSLLITTRPVHCKESKHLRVVF